MPNNPDQPPLAPSTGSSSPLKRPYGLQAQTNRARPFHTSSSTLSMQSSPSESRHRPKKAPKVETAQDSNGTTASSSRRKPSYPMRPSSSVQSQKPVPTKGKGKRKPEIRGLPEPLHDLAYITRTYKTKAIKEEWESNPKSRLANFHSMAKLPPPVYERVQYSSAKGPIFRAKVITPVDPQSSIIAYGDDTVPRVAEKLAALSAIYQLDGKDLLTPSQKAPVTQVTLQNGDVVTFELARHFMDYYCRRFGFGKPDIAYTEPSRKSASNWEAAMTVGGRRIGIGSGPTKKAALTSCYLDVTQYLESCDSDLWKTFREDAKTGKELGLASSVLLEVDDQIADQIEDLCADIKGSSLYRNRPRNRDLLTGDDDPNAFDQQAAPPKYVAPSRRRANEDFLAKKSQRLKERRKDYLQDPKMDTMRTTRMSLPVYTKASELLSHIRQNEVTICMAATGSGKTTQIPQLILDQYIDDGVGANCNIICTQPRRIAAISVANRVASERGEATGEGSVGYHVRFDSKLPQQHGSITFCTTGIFLKRMQSALEDGGTNETPLDDVTHVLVDEVHERDLDTDLLLVVLKRLLADRQAKRKPLKIVLMSATIDAKLFQDYFPDNKGVPAKVVDIPGRSFPVSKHFMNDFLPTIARDTRCRRVFQDSFVQTYITQELGPEFLRNMGLPPPSHRSNEESDPPHLLIAAAITHALHNSTDGHILVFLAGWDDITGVQKCLLESSLGLDYGSNKYSIHRLHSTVPLSEQQVIFDRPPEGQRRIILATNIAETSVTIPDVVYVVDSAKVKQQRYDPERHISSLVSAWIGSSNLNQRAGRAGRHRSGDYYGVLSRARAEALHPHLTVEMKRVDLSNVVMHIQALNFSGLSAEEVLAATIEPPSAERVEAAMQTLKMVGALDRNKNLTSLGRVLLQLPIDTQMGKMILFGSFFRCLDQALSLAALLSGRDPFVSPMHLRNEVAACKNSFCSDDYRSDALAALKAYNQWWAMQSRGDYTAANRFCADHFLSRPTLLGVQEIKSHILRSLYDIGVIEVSAGGDAPKLNAWYSRRELRVPAELNTNGDSLPLLAALIAIALQPKYAVRTNDKFYRTASEKVVFMHPSSVNNRKRMAQPLDRDNTPTTEKQLYVYVEKRQNISTGNANAQKFLVTTTRLDPLTYVMFGAHHVEILQRGLACDGWLPVIGNFRVLDDLERLKVLIESCMLRVFQGIIKAKRGRSAPRRDDKDNESDDEDDDLTESPLSNNEIRDLDHMTRNIVRLLNDYNSYRIANQSRYNSRPGTPMDSPSLLASRLPSAGGTQSGYNTPRHVGSAAFYSRPGTPSRLSRGLWHHEWSG